MRPEDKEYIATSKRMLGNKPVWQHLEDGYKFAISLVFVLGLLIGWLIGHFT